MPTTYPGLTRTRILQKVNRQRNPVTSILQLAREFGVDTSYQRQSDWYGRAGRIDYRTPPGFVNRVKSLIGEDEYNRIRRSEAVNYSYR